MRPEGVTLYRLIRAGAFSQELSIGPFEAGFECYFCQAPVEVHYETGVLEMECPDCEYQYGRTRLPPSAIDPASPHAALSLIDQYQRHEILALSKGVCPFCVNELGISLVSGDEIWMESAAKLDVMTEFACEHCGHRHYLSVGLALLYHSSLIAFFADHGVDITTIPHWELEFAMTDDAITIQDTDPWRVTLRLTRDDETFVLTITDDLTVVEDYRK